MSSTYSEYGARLVEKRRLGFPLVALALSSVIILAQQPAATTPDQQLAAARRAYQDKNFAAALEQLQPLAGAKDQAIYPSVLLYQALCQRGLGRAEADPAAARKQFEEGARAFAAAAQAFTDRVKDLPKDGADLPEDLEGAACARCGQAEMQLRLGQLDAARATLAPLLKERPWTHSRSHGLALYYHGFASLFLKDHVAAGRSLNALTPFDDPQFGLHARYLLARAYHREDERAEAINHYQGEIADYEARKKSAAEALQKPETTPQDPHEKARLEALVQGPPPALVGWANFYLGMLYYEGGLFTDAGSHFSDFVSQFPQSPLRAEAQLYQGLSEVQLRQYADALRTLQPLVDKEPALAAPVHFWLGKAQAGNADPEETETFLPELKKAVQSLRRAADLYLPAAKNDEASARRGEVLLELADTHQRAGQYQDAVAVLLQIQNEGLLPRRQEELLQRRLTALNLAGAYRESNQLAAGFLKTYPKSLLIPEVVFRQAENAYFLNQPAEAARLYQIVVEKYPEFPQASVARYGLALIAYHTGEMDKAREHLERIPPPDRSGELARVPYLLGDCLIRLAPTKADDALAAGRLQEHLNSAAELLNDFANGQPDDPLATDALLRLGVCQQRLAAVITQPEERTKLVNATRATYEKVLLEFPLNELQPRAAFERAKCLARAGDAASAIARLRPFAAEPLKKDPIAPLALLQLATLLRGLDGKAPEAAKILARCRQQYEPALIKDSARAEWVPLLKYHHAVALKEAGQFAEARALFERIIREFPSRAEAGEAVIRWGQALAEDGATKVDKGNQVLGMPDLKPTDAAAATKNIEEGNKAIRDAVQYFVTKAEEWRQQHPDSEVRARLLYQAIWSQRGFADAEAEAARVKRQQELKQQLQAEAAKSAPQGQPVPEVAAPEVTLAKIELQPTEKKVRALYQELISAFPDLPLSGDARLELAELHVQREDHATAIRLLGEALDKEPPAELADRMRLRLGVCHFAKGDLKAALGQFEVLAANPQHAQAGQGHYRAAECHWRLDNLAEAEKHLVVFRDVEVFQNQVGISDIALLRLGHLLGRHKQWEPARRAFEQLIARFGDSGWVPEARYGIGWTWQNQKDYPNALAAYPQAIGESTAESAARAQLQIGICQVEAKQLAEALTTLRAVPAKFPFPELSVLALAEAAHVAGQLKQPEQAEKLWRQVIHDYPKSPWAEIAKKRLEAADEAAPPPHELPAAVLLLTPDLKQPLGLDALGQQREERASLDDPTEEAAQAATLARLPPPRRAPAPWVRLALPDPFEYHQAIRLSVLPPEDHLPWIDHLPLPRP